jgi:hypothetical protein
MNKKGRKQIMNSQEESEHHSTHFIPEAVDEQIDRFSRLVEARTVNERLVHDLHHVCREYADRRDRVWARLSEQMTDHSRASMPEVASSPLSRKQRLFDERKHDMQQERLTLPQSHPARRRLELAAAVLVTAFVVGSLLWLLALTRHSGGGPAVSSKPTLPAASHRHCSDSLDLGWQTVCQQHLEQAINQTKILGNKKLTIEAAYADANRAIIVYTLSSASVTPKQFEIDIQGTLATRQGIMLQALSGSEDLLPGDPTTREGTADFDTAALPEQIRTLDLHLTMQIETLKTRQIHLPGGVSVMDPVETLTASFDFSITMQRSRIAHVNQTITVGGIPVTLQRVIVSPSETSLFVSGPRLRLRGTNISVDTSDIDLYSITIGNWSSQSRGMVTDQLTEPGQLPRRLEVVLYQSLFDKHGQWSFHISRQAVEGATGDWTFHFTVPA